MDIETYALLNKKIKGLTSGIKSANVNGTSIEFTMNDNSKQRISFPTPADGVSIQNVAIDKSNHLICTMTNNEAIDAGAIPVISGNVTSENGSGGLRVWNGKLQYQNKKGNWVVLMDVPDEESSIAEKDDIDNLFS